MKQKVASIFLIALQRSLEMAILYFFCRFFVSPFLVDIFHFFGYANTTCDITLHDDFSENLHLLKSSQTTAHKVT